MGGFLTLLADTFGQKRNAKLTEVQKPRYTPRHRALLILLIAILFATGGKIDWIFTRRDQFHTAFASEIPPALRNLTMSRHYAGGPRDTVTLMHFYTDPATIQHLTTARGMKSFPDDPASYLAGTEPWPTFWRSHMHMAFNHNAAWESVPHMKNPKVYSWQTDLTTPGPITSTTLIYDESTGEAYAILTVG